MKFRAIFLTALTLALASCASPPGNPVSLRETPAVGVIRQYAATVVNIRTETVVDLKEIPEWGEYGDELDKYFQQQFGRAYSEGILKYKSIGSGVILNNQGLVVTNSHVIDKARSIYAVLNDGTILAAEVVKKNRSADLAIIRVQLPRNVAEIKFADFGNIMIGETVIAIGDPLGLENSVTVGVVSGKDRKFSSQQCNYVCSELLQTDAPINPGSSGGALFNLDGELVGINLAVVQNAQNIGFAIPAYKIEALLKEIP